MDQVVPVESFVRRPVAFGERGDASEAGADVLVGVQSQQGCADGAVTAAPAPGRRRLDVGVTNWQFWCDRSSASYLRLNWARPERYVRFWGCPVRPPAFAQCRTHADASSAPR